MPNPKVGTVTMDVSKAVRVQGGQVEYRTDRHAIIYLPIGKLKLRRAGAARELRRPARRDHPGQAGVGEGSLPADGDDHHEHEPGIKIDPARTRGIVEEPAAVA